MPLKLRPTGLSSGIDRERPDYTVLTGEWEIVASIRRACPDRRICAALVPDSQRPDDALAGLRR